MEVLLRFLYVREAAYVQDFVVNHQNSPSFLTLLAILADKYDIPWLLDICTSSIHLTEPPFRDFVDPFTVFSWHDGTGNPYLNPGPNYCCQCSFQAMFAGQCVCCFKAMHFKCMNHMEWWPIGLAALCTKCRQENDDKNAAKERQWTNWADCLVQGILKLTEYGMDSRLGILAQAMTRVAHATACHRMIPSQTQDRVEARPEVLKLVYLDRRAG